MVHERERAKERGRPVYGGEPLRFARALERRHGEEKSNILDGGTPVG
jgi:hypothetical protein